MTKKLAPDLTNFTESDIDQQSDLALIHDTTDTELKSLPAGQVLNNHFNVKAYGATGDGSTDDTAAIQAALDAADTAGGGLVFLPIGTYSVDTVLLAGDNTTVKGVGRGLSVIRPESSVTGNDGAFGIIGAKGKSNCTFRSFTVDLLTNQCANNGIVLWPTDTSDMTGDPCVDCLITDCEVLQYDDGVGPTGYAIWSRRAQRSNILYNHVTGDNDTYSASSEQEGIEVFGGEDILVQGNKVRNVGNAGIFVTTENDEPDVQNHRITIAENHVTGCGVGIAATTNAYSAEEGLQILDGCLITENQVNDCYEEGIRVRQGTAPGTATDIVARNVKIKNNIVNTDNALSGASQNIGIEFDKQVDDGVLVGCELTGNSVSGGKSSTSKGLIYARRFNGGLIKDNIVNGDSTTGSESYYLMYVNQSDNVQVLGNTLHTSYRGTLAINECTSYKVSGNNIYDTDNKSDGFSVITLLGTQEYGVITDNLIDPRSNTKLVGSGDGSTKSEMVIRDNIIPRNYAAALFSDLLTDNAQGTATIADTNTSVTVTNDLVIRHTTGLGSFVHVEQLTGTIEAFTVDLTTDGQFTITRSGSSGEATYRYQIR